MAFAVIQSGAVNTSAYTAGVKTYTGLGALTVGSLVVCNAFAYNSRTFSSVTLGGLAMTEITSGSGSSRAAIFARIVTGGETGQNIVVTLSGSDTNGSAMAAFELSGNAADLTGATGVSEASASATSHDFGSVTPSTAHNLIFSSGERANRTWTTSADDGFTDLGASGTTYWINYIIQSSATAQTWNFSTGGSAGTATGSIAQFAGAASGVVGPLMGGHLLGGGILAGRLVA